MTHLPITRRRRRLACVLTVALLCAGGSASAQSIAQELALSDAVLRALVKNRDIAIERESVEQAEAAVERARAAHDPTFRAEGRYRDQRIPVTSILSGAPDGELAPRFQEVAASASYSTLLESGAAMTFSTSVARDTSNSFLALVSPAWFTSFGAEIRQPLLQNRRIDPARRAIKIAAVSRNRSQAALRRVVAETVAAVEQAYWMLVAADQDVEIRRASVGLAERQREDVQARIAGKVTPEADIAQPDAEIARRRGELLTATEARARTERALKMLILDSAADPAWNVPIRAADAPDAPASPVDLEAALASAAKERPELEDLDARVALQDIELEAARDRLRPQLDLVGSYTARGLAGAEHDGVRPFPGLSIQFPEDLDGALGSSIDLAMRQRFPDATAGIQLTIPIGHRAARADVAASQSARRQAVTTRERALLQIGLEVRNAVTAVDIASQRIDVARAAREAAEMQLQAEQDRFTAGLTTTFLVLTRQNDLVTSRVTEAAAKAAYRRAAAELSRAKGTLLSERRIELAPVR